MNRAYGSIALLVTLGVLVACSSSSDSTPAASDAGTQGGSSGVAGSGGAGGGQGGTAGIGGTGGSAGSVGKGGTAGQSGGAQGGSAGISGAAGTTGQGGIGGDAGSGGAAGAAGQGGETGQGGQAGVAGDAGASGGGGFAGQAGAAGGTGESCSDPIDLNNPSTATKNGNETLYQGTTAGSNNTTFGIPDCSAGALGSRRRLHKYTVGAQPTVLSVTTFDVGGTLTNTVLWAYLDCQDTATNFVCNENFGGTLFSQFLTTKLAAGSTLTLVVAGYEDSEEGPYGLSVVEMPAFDVAVSGTCAAPQDVVPGAYLGETKSTDANNAKGTCTGKSAPDAVFRFTVPLEADLKVRARPLDTNFDIGVYLTRSPCGTGSQKACKDSMSAGGTESLVASSLGAGTWYLFLDGSYASDYGPYVLAIDLKDRLAQGQPCDPQGLQNKCKYGTYCRGPGGSETCQAPASVLLQDTFDADLQPFTVTDVGTDGKTFVWCDPAGTCGKANNTDSVSGGPYARIADSALVDLDGEILRSPSLNATGLSTVYLEYNHLFDHDDLATDLAEVAVSLNGTTWQPVVLYTQSASGHVVQDISSVVAGKAQFFVRFRYDDELGGGSGYGGPWSIDDVRVVGF